MYIVNDVCNYLLYVCSMQCIEYTNVFGLDNFEEFESKLKTSLEKKNIHVYLLLRCMKRELLTAIKNGKMGSSMGNM